MILTVIPSAATPDEEEGEQRYKLMGGPLRMTPGEFVHHVLDRANGRVSLCEYDGDSTAFERVAMRILPQSCVNNAPSTV
ncbi:MAG: hypothetical protein IT391_01530 [Nitrospira sp.]|nr:hypothetical protein [Nitrospira sp.]